MAERMTAAGQLARILAILPRAVRAGGVPLAELAGELAMTEKALLRDLEEVVTREYYRPAGGAGDIQVMIGPEAVSVFTTREFRRPPRLSPREMLALGLGLRLLAAESAPAARAPMLALAQKLESGVIGAAPEDLLGRLAIDARPDSPEGIRASLLDAARARRRCGIAYLKPGSPHPEWRDVDPYVLIASGLLWYLIAFDHRSGEIRVFRADRVVEVARREGTFAPPTSFDPAAYVREGRVYRAGEEVPEVEVPVRYSARIARWIEEFGPVERQEDGAVIVRHQVADPGWLVRHVLEHGPDAEVLAPPEMRARVREAAGRVVEG